MSLNHGHLLNISILIHISYFSFSLYVRVQNAEYLVQRGLENTKVTATEFMQSAKIKLYEVNTGVKYNHGVAKMQI